MPSTDKSITLPLTINHSFIVRSRNKLLFIHYTPNGTIKARWYLVQVDIESKLNIDPLCTTMVDNIVCQLQSILTTNIKANNSVYGGSIGTHTGQQSTK